MVTKKEWEQRRTDNNHNRSAREAWIRALLIDRPLTEHGIETIDGYLREIADLDYAYDQLVLNGYHKAQSD